MTDRPMLTREARLACPHLKTVAIRSDLPDSWGGRQWCRACGCFFACRFDETDDDGVPEWEEQIDFSFTNSADAS
jgi:hypothetical protein